MSARNNDTVSVFASVYSVTGGCVHELPSTGNVAVAVTDDITLCFPAATLAEVRDMFDAISCRLTKLIVAHEIEEEFEDDGTAAELRAEAANERALAKTTAGDMDGELDRM